MARSRNRPAGTPFDIHPGVEMMRKWAAELAGKTGRSLDQWAKFIKNSSIETRKDRITFLKTEHGLGTNTAWQIVLYAEDKHTWDGDPDAYLAQAVKYVEDQYAGPKATLRSIFDSLVSSARKLGKDVKVCPCKTIVPFYRKRVFAEVKPATRTRVELSLALVDVPLDGILQPNRRANGKDRLKHQIHLATAAEITPEVLKWLRLAYDQDA